MDKEFWISIAKSDYKIPKRYTLEELTKTLFGYLDSSDPELRDDIGYIVYANFLKREMYTQDEIKTHVDELLANLDKGIGETETDSVFLRTFSVLFLAEIVYNDNKKPLLDKTQVDTILSKVLAYLNSEQDPRGYIPIKGWAHALAHTADLLQELGKSRFLEKNDLENILQGIADKLVHSTNWIYIHGEDERLANAVTAILQRDLVTMKFFTSWLKSLVESEYSWKGSYADEGRSKAFHNTRNFLRSLFVGIRASDDLPEKEQVEAAVFDALTNLKPF
ncbi:MAG TPA: DUF2785 domain-containing protein [Anaerolineales bacterium]|nr:DUF2785 domain-containing protein [Anaerolineales bacterium]